MTSLTNKFSWNALPDPGPYIERLKSEMLSALAQDLDLLAKGARELKVVLRLLQVPYLRSCPRLLHGLNTLLRPNFRLEFSTDVSDVDYFVLVEGSNSHVYGFSESNPYSVTSDQSVREALDTDEAWKKMREKGSGRQWMESLAQVLQEILDDPSTDHLCRKLAHKRLVQLAKEDIAAPPSLFIRFLDDHQPKDIREAATCTTFGGFCTIYKANLGPIPTCLRLLHQTQASDVKKMHTSFFTEIVIWRQLKHSNIIPFFGASFDIFPNQCCFVLPWLENGSLRDYLEKKPDFNKTRAIRQIVDGVAYLHGLVPPVVHKDIKAANILVDRNENCVLTDFGLSSILDSKHLSTMRGTLYWMPPEAFPDAPLDNDGRPRDVYSLGCTMYEILTESDPRWIMFTVIRGQAPSLPPPSPSSKEWPDEELLLWQVVAQCVAVSPDQRPDIFAVKEKILALPSKAPPGLQSDMLQVSGPDAIESVGADKPPPYSEAEAVVVEWIAKALYDYKSEDGGDLNFRKGDLLLVTDKSDDWWFATKSDGTKGSVPSNFVSLLPL